MKVISIGMGDKVFEEGSAVRGRQISYGHIFDGLHLVVFTPDLDKYQNQNLAQNVFLYPTKSKIRIFYIFDYLRIVRNIIKNIGEKDVVISTQDPFETGIVGVILKLIYRLPLQVQIHTDFSNKYFISHSALNTIRFLLSHLVLSFADSVRVVSTRIGKNIHTDPKYLSVLPIFIKIDESRTQIQKIERMGSKVTFLSVSRLEKEKDLATAIKAFKMVCDSGIDAEFVIVGDGSERKMLENMTKIYNLQNKIHFAGWQNDTTSFYKKADIYVSTSLYEGYGMSIVEAGFAGLALVISDTGVAGEEFRNGEEAIVCRPKDTEAFGRAMILLAQDSEMRMILSQKANSSAKNSIISEQDYLQKYRQSFNQAIEHASLNQGLFKSNILARYVAAGLTGAGTQISLLYIFTDIVKIWYIYSSIIAFISAIIVSFLLQKFWTFKDGSTKKIHHQAIKYLVTAISGLIANTALLYLFVDLLGLWYIFAQIVIGGLIMVFNFLMYKFFVFKK